METNYSTVQPTQDVLCIVGHLGSSGDLKGSAPNLTENHAEFIPPTHQQQSWGIWGEGEHSPKSHMQGVSTIAMPLSHLCGVIIM